MNIAKNNLQLIQKTNFLYQLSVFNRNGHTLRGKPPGVALNLKQRLKREFPIDKIESKLPVIDIGFPQLKSSRSVEQKNRLEYLKAERAKDFPDRNNFLINLEKVHNDSEQSTLPYQLKTIAEHYGIYKDLFGNRSFFIPRVTLNIDFNNNDNDFSHPVYNGNIILPEFTTSSPNIQFNGNLNPITGYSESSNYWSLVLINPDGNYGSKDQEHCHWFIGNIPNSELAKGDTIVPYLQPFPPKGIGCQRFIFILYKQNKKINFDVFKVNEEEKNIEKYKFNTLEFYRKYQDDITPAGLSFFQSKWDESLTKFYHTSSILNGKQPIFEYDFPKPYIAEQKWFPLRQPFDIYLDKHNEERTREYQVRAKLKTIHPFQTTKKLKFPNAIPFDKNLPSWLNTKIKKNRLGIGRINDV